MKTQTNWIIWSLVRYLPDEKVRYLADENLEIYAYRREATAKRGTFVVILSAVAIH